MRLQIETRLLDEKHVRSRCDGGFGEFFPPTDFRQKIIHLEEMMGSLILCHDQHAFPSVRKLRGSTVRYLQWRQLLSRNNLYLIDYTIMNEQLCGWLKRTSGKGSLQTSFGCDPMCGEVWKICTHDFEEFRNLQGSGDDPNPECFWSGSKTRKDIERQKYKGDNLLKVEKWKKDLCLLCISAAQCPSGF